MELLTTFPHRNEPTGGLAKGTLRNASMVGLLRTTIPRKSPYLVLTTFELYFIVCADAIVIHIETQARSVEINRII